MRFRHIIPLLLGLSSCVAQDGGFIEDDIVDLCADVKQSVMDDCVIDGVFTASATCDPVIVAELLAQACPSLMNGEPDLELCELGIAANCPANDVPEIDTVAECSSYIQQEGADACDFYLCREEQTSKDERCGRDGYYIGYGYKYCNRFQDTAAQRLTPQGVNWVQRVMPCLMEAIEDEVEDGDSCETILQIAFDSHPQCYVDSGFCDLSFEDMAFVFLTVELSDFDFQQVLVTGISCLQQWGTE